MGKWIGVDLDGTLAKHDGTVDGPIGPALKPMLERVKGWLEEGREVRIFTARADSALQRVKIVRWLDDNGIGGLAITNKKDWEMLELWDDRVIRVKHNNGAPCRECSRETKFSYSLSEF